MTDKIKHIGYEWRTDHQYYAAIAGIWTYTVNIQVVMTLIA